MAQDMDSTSEPLVPESFGKTTASVPPPEQAALAELFSLRDRVALVTGASGHLGQAMAAALAEAGARVIVSSRDFQKGQDTAAALPKPAGAPHFAVEMDHLQEASIAAGFSAAVDQAGRIDILVNNGNASLAQDWTSVTGEQFQNHLANVTGYFLLARHVHDHAVAHRRPASIILLGSMYGVVGSYPDAYAGICAASPVAYHALKGGIIQMTRHLAVYWAKDGVRVNCLSPGPFPGPRAPQEMVQRLCEKSPMGRMGRAQELKGAIVFLAADASSYITGQNLLVDGGWTAW